MKTEVTGEAHLQPCADFNGAVHGDHQSNEPTVDFPYDEVDHNLGLLEPDITPQEYFESGAELLHGVLVWLAEGRTKGAIGTRAVALIAMVRPGLLANRSTLCKVSENTGIDKGQLSKLFKDFAAHTGYRPAITKKQNPRPLNRGFALQLSTATEVNQ